MYEFLADLDEYFCEKYANYDKLCVLPGYKTPVMQATRLDEFGRAYAYTLPADTMRLAAQEKKKELLSFLKEKMTDTSFSFSFQPLGFFAAWKNKLSKYGFKKNFVYLLSKYGLSAETVGQGLSVAPEIWKKICGGSFLPTKNLIFSIALTAQFSMQDTATLMTICGYEMDYATPKDVVVSYLLENKIYNAGMMEAALNEYKVRNLFIAA